MNEQRIKFLLMSGKLKRSSPDQNRAYALIESSLKGARALKDVQISEKTAEIVFKEIYDSFRKLADAKWHILGYKSDGHEASSELIASAEIPSNFKLKSFDRFRKIRNEAAYDGKAVTLEQAKEIVTLWNETHKELIEWAKK